MAFVLAFGHQPFSLGRQRNGFGQTGAPKVKHPLRVFGVANQAVFFTLAFNGHLGAVTRNNWNPLARPFLFFQDFHCGQFAPLHHLAVGRTAFNFHNASVGHHFFGRQFVGPFLCPIGQHHQVNFFAVNVKVFGNAYVFLCHPFGAAVTGRTGLESHAIVGAWVHLPEYVLWDYAGHQHFFSVGTIGRHAVGVKVNGKRIVDWLNVDFLVKRIFADVIGHDAPVTPTHPHGVSKRGVVSGVSVAVDFNVTGNAFDHLGDLQIAFVVDGVNLDAWALLALLILDLAAICVDLVDRQARAGFKVAAVLNLNWPLIARGKFQILKRR